MHPIRLQREVIVDYPSVENESSSTELVVTDAELVQGSSSLPFTSSAPLTIGVELELQLINVETQNLTTEADDLLRRLQHQPVAPHLKPEITQSMIEINSGVHARFDTLLPEMMMIRDALLAEARRMNIGICGGGNHPFQRWNDRRIYPTDRFLAVAEKYGYLAKQFTVFGQHIHIGVPDGDDALYLTHSFARYVPHFVALAASSPFYQDADTSFDSSRLSIVNAFPLAGHAPEVLRWDEFLNYFDKMSAAGAVSSMKDFYWDIRPKPEFGTVELRICDTPLTVGLACDLAAYAQTIAAWLLADRARGASVFNIADIYLPYALNRFEACRYGFAAELINIESGIGRILGEDILATIETLKPYAATLGTEEPLARIGQMVFTRRNGARWLRDRYTETDSMWDVVAEATARWAQ
jgi:glutamate---cysteine ligase / carboxylate-amine ligase